ncbi:MAG: Hsp20/alpha crystallin family protein [Euzebyales bacterium]|nr:Hsp20/alpha crystallin family protein [Euzebyales bacterium]
MPGLDRGDVDVAVNEGMLTISGERKVDADVPEDAWVRRERAVGGFERSFSLPEGTDPSAISASFDRGLLELHLPHPPERRPRKIEITSSEPAQDAVEVGSGTGTQSSSSS